jgi:hypothetical protein
MDVRIAAGVAVALMIAASKPVDATLFQTPAPHTATVTVDARHPWVDSGLTVNKGDPVTFVAEGTIQWGADPRQVAGPEGHGGPAGKIGKGGLIGRIGVHGKPFPIGATRTPIVMTKSGTLFLGINDFVFGDNAGAFTVRVTSNR